MLKLSFCERALTYVASMLKSPTIGRLLISLQFCPSFHLSSMKIATARHVHYVHLGVIPGALLRMLRSTQNMQQCTCSWVPSSVEPYH